MRFVEKTMATAMRPDFLIPGALLQFDSGYSQEANEDAKLIRFLTCNVVGDMGSFHSSRQKVPLRKFFLLQGIAVRVSNVSPSGNMTSCRGSVTVYWDFVFTACIIS